MQSSLAFVADTTILQGRTFGIIMPHMVPATMEDGIYYVTCANTFDYRTFKDHENEADGVSGNTTPKQDDFQIRTLTI